MRPKAPFFALFDFSLAFQRGLGQNSGIIKHTHYPTKEITMNEAPKPEDNLTDEFRSLGRNLLNTLQAAWDRPERKNLSQEIETGLTELINTLKDEAGNLASSPTGQKVKTEAEDLRQRVQTGEVDTAVRSELLKALQTVNAELAKAVSRLAGDQDRTGNDQESS
jgi:hypothetical protein